MSWFRRFVLFMALAHVSVLTAAPVLRTGTVIRDSEIETLLKSYTYPIFRVAGLDPKRLQMLIIVDPELNAWATSDYTIAVHTGLITASSTPEQLIGVLAHETGHIAGGHIVGLSMMAEKSTKMAMASVVLGMAAAALGGGDAGMGAMSAGMQMAQNNFMHFSRGQEGSADSAGVRYLDALGWSSLGFLEFMEKLAGQEFLSPESQNSYMRTHPFSQDRVDFLKRHVQVSRFKEARLPAVFYDGHRRLVAKLKAYLEPPQSVYFAYPKTDTSVPARYARAIAFYREGRTMESIALLDKLIHENPHDPYFYELKGQVLFDNGQLAAAAIAFEWALKQAPSDPLIQVMYARVLIEIGGSDDIQGATKRLESALKTETDNAELYHLLAIVYGKTGQIGRAALALAEEALLNRKYDMAISQAKRAIHFLPKGPLELRAEDLKEFAEREAARENRF